MSGRARSMFDEALRQERLALERLELDPVRATGHAGAAWDATDEAQRLGMSADELRPVRLRLVDFSIGQWLPRVEAYIDALKRPREREEWRQGVAGALRSGLGWYQRELAAGTISRDPQTVTNAWRDVVEQHVPRPSVYVGGAESAKDTRRP